LTAPGLGNQKGCPALGEIMRKLLLFQIVFLLASCTAGPDYVRPPVETPEAYRERPEATSEAKGWKQAEPKAEIVRGKWWEIFNDPELNRLEDQVNISNQNILGAEARFRQARALAQAARAGYFPTVAAGASYTRSKGSANSVSGKGGGIGSTASSYTLPVDVNWDLDLWGKVKRTVEAAGADAESIAAELESVRLGSQAELAQDYFELRSLDAQKQILDKTVSSYEDFLQLTRNRYAGGVSSSIDVLQAETQLKTTQALSIDIGVQRSRLEHAIALIIGKPASAVIIKPAASPLAGIPVIPAGLPSELLERRPDIAAAERLMAAANAGIGIAGAAFFPTVSLSSAFGLGSSHLSDWFSWPSRFWSLGGAVTEAVFEGGLRRAQTEAARASYEATVASYRQTVLAAFQEVEDNLSALRILGEEAGVQDEALNASGKALEATMNQYKAGTVSYLNVITAQTAKLNNERAAADILGRRAVSSVLLIKALGGGWRAAELNGTLDQAGPPRH